MYVAYNSVLSLKPDVTSGRHCLPAAYRPLTITATTASHPLAILAATTAASRTNSRAPRHPGCRGRGLPAPLAAITFILPLLPATATVVEAAGTARLNLSCVVPKPRSQHTIPAWHD
jgi:hypothetical protein